MAHESEALCAVERVAPSGNRFVPYGLSWDRVVTGWQRALAIVVLVHATLAIGCSRFDEMSWKEQAWLDDGSTVLLDRNARRLSSGFPNARRGPIVHQEIRYAPLKVAWATDGSETPMSFDIVDGSAYLVTIPSVPTASFCAGKPKGAYLANFYVWRDGSQRTISQAEAPVDRLRQNISGVSQWGLTREGDKTYLSWSDVAGATGQLRDARPTPISKQFERTSGWHCEG
jgi:hypothetical protein